MITDTVLGDGMALAQNATTTSGGGGGIQISWELVALFAVVGAVILGAIWLFMQQNAD